MLMLIGGMSLPLKSATSSGSQESWEELMWLAVDKTTLRADLRTLPPPGQGKPSMLLHRFRIAIGKKTGDKEREGDNRTPEGIYFALNHIEADNLLASKYGQRAIPLNFPNPVDRLDKKTGYGIWLHGAGNDDRIADAQVTEGCVAFYNADILKLKSWIRPHQSLVVIAKDLSAVNVDQDRKDVLDLTKAWVSAWESQNIDQYIDFYSDSFHQGGKSKKAYYNYKKRVFSSYKKMSIDHSGMWVVTHPKYAVSFMNQDFKGDQRFRSVGRKILYWMREAKGWKIIAEKFNKNLFKPMAFDEKDLKSLTLGSKPDPVKTKI